MEMKADEGRCEVLDMEVVGEVKEMKKMKMELREFVRGERKVKVKCEMKSSES